jgi:CRISPR-associated endonuclease/helicase Cas3
VVNVNSYYLKEYQDDGLIAELMPDLWEWIGTYDDRKGLIASGINPDHLVVSA